MEKEERLFIYISRDKFGIKFLLLNEDCINDGRKADGIIVNYKNLKLAKVNAGCIFKMLSTKDGSQITWSNPLYSSDWWKNSDDRIKWQVEQRQKEDLEASKKQAKQDDIENFLRPLKLQLDRHNTRQERTIIIARIIDYLTH